MTTQTDYVLGSSEAERARLLYQAKLFEREAHRLLDEMALGPGGRALDVGCGPLGVLDLLVERVGPAGEVVGLDREPRMLAMAHATLAERGVAGVRLVEGDATATGLPRGTFDFAHARLLLVNVPDPGAVVAEMAAVVRPGGVVAVQDVDWISWTCDPPHPAWDRLLAANRAVWAAGGMDVCIGRRLPALLRGAGLVDLRVEARAPFYVAGDPYHTLLLAFTAMHRERLLEQGTLTATELDDLTATLRTHLDDPGTVTLWALFVQAWGRRPAA
jgi:SAM-dependent methyltransferase